MRARSCRRTHRLRRIARRHRHGRSQPAGGRRYEADELNAPSLDDLTPESVFKSCLEDRFKAHEDAQSAFCRLMPLLNEAVEEVHVETRPALESAEALNHDNNAEEVPA